MGGWVEKKNGIWLEEIMDGQKNKTKQNKIKKILSKNRLGRRLKLKLSLEEEASKKYLMWSSKCVKFMMRQSK